MKTYAVKTFGCSMNYSDSERVATVLEKQGLHHAQNIMDADVVILNTCSIKQKAEDKAFSIVNNVYKNGKKEGRDVKVVLTGCMVKKSSSQKDKERDPLLVRIPEIDTVFRIEDTMLLPALLGIGKASPEEDYFHIIPKYKNDFQAIVPIQSGCDNFCTFCVVPSTRGREKSRPIEQILREVKALAKKGVKEIILVGQNVNSYGKGLATTKRKFDEENSKWIGGTAKTPFAILLEEVSEVEGVQRIRFQSSNPHDITDDIIQVICERPQIMPHLHFALQSGDNKVLKKMNRKHSYEEYREIVEKIRKYRPDFAITTDIIVGFCDETDEAFENSMKAIEEIDVDMIYISQYSVRPGTVAHDVFEDNIPAAVKKERWHKMNDWLKQHVSQKLQSLIGTKQRVLIDVKNEQENFIEGKTDHNRVCRIYDRMDIPLGEIVEVEIIDTAEWSLQGEVNSGHYSCFLGDNS